LDALANDNATARWPEKVAYLADSAVLQPHEIDPAIAATIQQTMIDEQQLLCTYQSASANTLKTLRLTPKALVQRGHTRYLLATREGFSDIRQYALHRFRIAAPLTTSAPRDTEFDMQVYLAQKQMQFGVRGHIQLHTWVSDQLAHLLSETLLSGEMKLSACANAQGKVLSATVADSWELRWWLLSHAGSVVEYQPEQLRADLQQKLEKAVTQYQHCGASVGEERVLGNEQH
tara:strand:- start:1505 stop:2200 length:696 start_codon:yes stop_codon:yes gene_type:complete